MQRIISDKVITGTVTQPTDEVSVYRIYQKYTHGIPVYGSPSPRVYDNNRDMVVNPLNHFGIDLNDIAPALKNLDSVKKSIAKAQELANQAKTDVVTPE